MEKIIIINIKHKITFNVKILFYSTYMKKKKRLGKNK